jgi:hypothetical protein
LEAKCRCRFDVLRDSIMIEKSGNFVPAMFIIEAEWISEKKETKGNSSQIEALTMPPDKATALIVLLLFNKFLKIFTLLKFDVYVMTLNESKCGKLKIFYV